MTNSAIGLVLFASTLASAPARAASVQLDQLVDVDLSGQHFCMRVTYIDEWGGQAWLVSTGPTPQWVMRAPLAALSKPCR